MKKSLSLVLAVLMVVALVPVTALTAFATESTASSYLVYQQDFSSVEANATGTVLMEQLGWYVPFSKADMDAASYSVVEKESAAGGKALRIDTRNATTESFVNVFGGDVMPLLSDSNFTLEYRLTYSELTTNNDGYAALIYNYNGLHGSVANGEGNEVYGIAAVRMCGTGFNAVYYPVQGADCALHSLERDGQTMASRYDNPDDTQSSLYARLFPEAANESMFSNRIYKGSNVMKNRALNIKIDYDYEDGVTVYINGILVSTTNMEVQNAGYTFRTEKLWEDFVARNDGATVALLTQPGVVADVDDIVITTTDVNATDNLEMPNLLITEVSALPDDYWTKFIEIHNPTDKPVDVANYTLLKSPDFTDGYATDNIGSTRDKTFTTAAKLGDFFGQEIRNRDAQYFTASELAAIPSWDYAQQWYFTDAEIALIKEMGVPIEKISTTRYGREQNSSGDKAYGNSYNYGVYDNKTYKGNYYLCSLGAPVTFTKDANNAFVPDANGIYYLANYVEKWNTRYVRGNDDYATNTMLNPGDTMVLVMLSVGYLPVFTDGAINNAQLSTEYGSKGFRYTYRNYGLSKETKVLGLTNFTMSDLEMATLAIGRTEDENGVEIDYSKQYTHDLTNLESLVRYTPILATGRGIESDSMFESNTIGTGGVYRMNASASYVYGVDASSDYRIGTLYTSATPVKSQIKDVLNSQMHKSYSGVQHVGKLADYQEILFQHFYKRTAENPPLMITEILPLTYNLEGEEKNAFAAIELTNTSGKALSVYDYALTRTSAGHYGNNDKGFKYSTLMRPGNPVDRGDGNSAYYYFAEDNISNPETCVLQHGESVVVWFLSADTYSSYYNDDEFGFEYFRQYWVNNGCPDLGLQVTDGEYAVKVIAVDGCDDATYNACNVGRVFAPATGSVDSKGRSLNDSSAIYGVAKATSDVTNGYVLPKDVVSIAYFGLASTYYELNKTELPATNGTLDPGTGKLETYYTNVLKCARVPVNTGMRFVAGATYSNRISAMKQSLKVNYAAYSNNKVYYTTSATATLNHELRANNALQSAGLGVLEGVEAYGLSDTVIQTVQSNNTAMYRYFSQQKNVVATLSGAAVSTAEGDAKLRFDSAIRLNTFTTLAATYGDNFTYSTLVIKSDLLQEDTVMTKDNLKALGATEVATSLLYYTEEYAVLGAAYTVGASDYGTEYTAVAYMEIKTADGKTHTYCSGIVAQRSVSAVARLALRDLRSEADDSYQYQVEENGKYSRYTSAERDRLKVYEG